MKIKRLLVAFIIVFCTIMSTAAAQEATLAIYNSSVKTCCITSMR